MITTHLPTLPHTYPPIPRPPFSALVTPFHVSFQLAIVQFSHYYRTELDFHQYQKFHNLTDVINNLKLLGGGTRTFGAISYAL